MIHVWDLAGEMKCHQTLTPPSIYLDHCAIRKIADSPDLSSRLIDAIKDRNGTVVLTLLNGLEFSGVTDLAQIRRAGDLITSIYPHLFFMQFDPWVVGTNEQLRSIGQMDSRLRLPCDDRSELLKLNSLLMLESGQIRWPGNRFFDLTSEQRIEMQTGLLAGKAEARETIAAVRAKMREPDYAKNARARLRNAGKEMGNRRGRVIAPEILTQLIFEWESKTRNRAFDDNSATDLAHATVPAAYCDFVVLDKEWCDLVDRARLRFRQNNIKTPLARVFKATEMGIAKAIDAVASSTKTSLDPVWLDELYKVAKNPAAAASADPSLDST